MPITPPMTLNEIKATLEDLRATRETMRTMQKALSHAFRHFDGTLEDAITIGLVKPAFAVAPWFNYKIRQIRRDMAD